MTLAEEVKYLEDVSRAAADPAVADMHAEAADQLRAILMIQERFALQLDALRQLRQR